MIRVTTKNPTGGGYDITSMIDGLSWSSVNPGGDETASFTFRRPWSRDNAEIARGSVVAITDGFELLWTGRIEEHDRGGDQTEEVAVTAYGLGIRLKDNTMTEIYVDRDLGQWGEWSVTRRSLWTSLSIPPVGAMSVLADQWTGLPAVQVTLPQGSTGAIAEAFYDAGAGTRIASVYYDLISKSVAGDEGKFRALDDDAYGGEISGSDLLTGADSSAAGTYTLASPKQFLTFTLVGAGTATAERSVTVRRVAVFGNHGLAKRGSAPTEGFYDSDIVINVISRVPGVVVRRIDQGSFVITQSAYKEPIDHESVITDVSRFENRDWGTFGSDNVLNPSSEGQFDYKLKDTSARQWSIRRSECAALDLHSEMSTLFDTVVVNYQDESGTAKTVTRTRTSPDLVAAGASPKTLVLDAGVLSPAAAQTLGDVSLALAGAFAPARGSVRIDGRVRHIDRGDVPAFYMKADGSNLQVPDILPSNTMLALDDSPDRRTTFPIKRVAHDAGGDVVSTTVELDQSNDSLTQLQNRLDAAARRTLG